jgi:hypothetical protein
MVRSFLGPSLSFYLEVALLTLVIHLFSLLISRFKLSGLIQSGNMVLGHCATLQLRC